jgi:hypothetical protein
MTESQLNLYQALTNLMLKVVITFSVLGCFITGFGFLIYLVNENHPWQNLTILGGIDGLIGLSLPIVLRHFFPDKSS